MRERSRIRRVRRLRPTRSSAARRAAAPRHTAATPDAITRRLPQRSAAHPAAGAEPTVGQRRQREQVADDGRLDAEPDFQIGRQRRLQAAQEHRADHDHAGRSGDNPATGFLWRPSRPFRQPRRLHRNATAGGPRSEARAATSSSRQRRRTAFAARPSRTASPPTGGPTSVPSDMPAMAMPSARPRRSAGNAAASRASPAVQDSPPAAPCTARATNSMAWPSAVAKRTRLSSSPHAPSRRPARPRRDRTIGRRTGS